jgi:hypothetical protein
MVTEIGSFTAAVDGVTLGVSGGTETAEGAGLG